MSQARRRVAIGPAGIKYGSEVGSISLPWSSFKKVYQYRKDIYFTQGKLTGIIVPGRAFSNPNEASAFAHSAENFRGSRIGAGISQSNTISFICDIWDISRTRAYRERLAIIGPAMRVISAIGKTLSAGALIYGVSPLFGAPGSIADAWHILSIVFAVAIATALQMLIQRKGARFAAASLLEPAEVSLASNGVTRVTPLGKDLVEWSAFSEIIADKHAVYLLSRKADSVFIPKRAFAFPEAADRFLEIARDFQAGKTPTPDPPIWPPSPSR